MPNFDKISAMRLIETDIKFASDEKYFLYEEKSELKHELINGNLYEMSGSSKYHNILERRLANLLEELLGTNYEVYIEGFKVRTPDGNFFYPDVIVSNPTSQKYYSEEPVILVEVLSDSTRKYDITDKFIQYRKFNSLEYYLCVEPEQQVVIMYYKNENREWVAETYSKDEDRIDLNLMNASFTLKDIYKPQ